MIKEKVVLCKIGYEKGLFDVEDHPIFKAARA